MHSEDEDNKRALWNKFMEENGKEVYLLIKKAQMLKRVALIILLILVLPMVLTLLGAKPATTPNLSDTFFIIAQAVPMSIFIWSRIIVFRYNDLWRKFKKENQAIN